MAKIYFTKKQKAKAMAKAIERKRVQANELLNTLYHQLMVQSIQ